jgi:hypothetical protein
MRKGFLNRKALLCKTEGCNREAKHACNACYSMAACDQHNARCEDCGKQLCSICKSDHSCQSCEQVSCATTSKLERCALCFKVFCTTHVGVCSFCREVCICVQCALLHQSSCSAFLPSDLEDYLFGSDPDSSGSSDIELVPAEQCVSVNEVMQWGIDRFRRREQRRSATDPAVASNLAVASHQQP